MDLILGFILIGIGVILGWYFREYYAMRVVHNLLKEVGEQVEDEEEPSGDRIKMRLERHGEVIYAFKDEDDSFIAQGKDLHELDKAIVARFPGQKFSVREQDLIDIKADYHEPV